MCKSWAGPGGSLGLPSKGLMPRNPCSWNGGKATPSAEHWDWGLRLPGALMSFSFALQKQRPWREVLVPGRLSRRPRRTWPTSPLSTTVASLWQWHRTPTTQETDGFQVKRPGDVSVRCTLLLMLDYQVRTGCVCAYVRACVRGWTLGLA